MNMNIKITNGFMPKNSIDDAGYDLRTPVDLRIEPSKTVKIPLGIAIHIGDCDLGGFIYPRSSTGCKGLRLDNTVPVIDSAYTGEIMLVVTNFKDVPLEFSRGDKIAQMVFHKIEHPVFQEVSEHTKTKRGSGAFGSSGK